MAHSTVKDRSKYSGCISKSGACAVGTCRLRYIVDGAWGRVKMSNAGRGLVTAEIYLNLFHYAPGSLSRLGLETGCQDLGEVQYLQWCMTSQSGFAGGVPAEWLMSIHLFD
jgi:hypothetical protein